MSNRNRLREYIIHMTKDEIGWKSEYEKSITGGNKVEWPWLAGHYSGLLDDLIRIIGRDRVGALVAADEAINERLAFMADERKDSTP